MKDKKPVKQSSNQSALNEDSKKAVAKIVGSQNFDFAEHILNQALNSLWMPDGLSEEQKDKRIKAAVAMIKEIAPKDGIEGILATQMIATHDAAMECLRRASITNQTFQGRDMALKHAAKLLRLQLDQVKILNKHRGKGDQKVVIEHVNIEPGAQAIVGNVEVNGGASNKKDAQQIPAHQEQPINVDATTISKKSKLPVKNAQRKK